jgi:hypothetical protein
MKLFALITNFRLISLDLPVTMKDTHKVIIAFLIGIIAVLVIIAVTEGVYILHLHAKDAKSPRSQLTDSAKPSSPDTIIGSWEIRSKPPWVDAAHLAFRNNTWQFLPGGVCNLGTATGAYELLPPNRVKVQLPMQMATPGFIGVFDIKVLGRTLTLTNLAQSQPVILERSSQ